MDISQTIYDPDAPYKECANKNCDRAGELLTVDDFSKNQRWCKECKLLQINKRRPAWLVREERAAFTFCFYNERELIKDVFRLGVSLEEVIRRGIEAIRKGEKE